jgi:F-type H+-transporting ATPase subunit b
VDLIGQIVQNWWHIPILMALVLVYGILLNWVLFRPVTRVVEARRKAVREAGGLSERSRDELARKFAEYERVVLEARRRASQVKETARDEAYAYRSGLLDKVREEVSAEAKSRREELARAREVAREDLASQTAALAAGMASKVLGREVRA